MRHQSFVFNGKLNLTVVGLPAFLCLAAVSNVSAAILGEPGNNAAPDAVSALAQQTKIVEADGVADDGFGDGAAISGDTLVVGAPGRRVGTTNFQGAVYIYVRNGTTWTLQQQVNSDVSGNDDFGSSVSINGDSIAVGAAGGQSFFYYRPSATPAANFVTLYWGTGGDVPQRAILTARAKRTRRFIAAAFITFSTARIRKPLINLSARRAMRRLPLPINPEKQFENSRRRG